MQTTPLAYTISLETGGDHVSISVGFVCVSFNLIMSRGKEISREREREMYTTARNPRESNRQPHTIRMPHIAQEPHRRRRQRIVPWELELGGEDASFEGSSLWTLDQGFPDEDILLADGPRRDAFGWVRGQVLVLGEEPFGGYGSCHRFSFFSFIRSVAAPGRGLVVVNGRVEGYRGYSAEVQVERCGGFFFLF